MLSKSVIEEYIFVMRSILDSIEEDLEKAAEKQQLAAEQRGRRQIRELISQAKSLRKYTLNRGKGSLRYYD